MPKNNKKQQNKVEVSFHKGHNKINEMMRMLDLGFEGPGTGAYITEAYILTTATNITKTWMRKVKDAIERACDESGFEAINFKFKIITEEINL